MESVYLLELENYDGYNVYFETMAVCTSKEKAIQIENKFHALYDVDKENPLLTHIREVDLDCYALIPDEDEILKT